MKFLQATLRIFCVSDILRVMLSSSSSVSSLSSSSSSSSVIDHRWHQSLLKTKKWYRNRQRVFYWRSFYILTWHIRFKRVKKRKNINFLTDLRISASLDIFQFTNATIRLFFFVLSLSSLWTVSLEHILRPSPANTKCWQLFRKFRPA